MGPNHEKNKSSCNASGIEANGRDLQQEGASDFHLGSGTTGSTNFIDPNVVESPINARQDSVTRRFATSHRSKRTRIHIEPGFGTSAAGKRYSTKDGSRGKHFSQPSEELMLNSSDVGKSTFAPHGRNLQGAAGCLSQDRGFERDQVNNLVIHEQNTSMSGKLPPPSALRQGTGIRKDFSIGYFS